MVMMTMIMAMMLMVMTTVMMVMGNDNGDDNDTWLQRSWHPDDFIPVVVHAIGGISTEISCAERKQFE